MQGWFSYKPCNVQRVHVSLAKRRWRNKEALLASFDGELTHKNGAILAPCIILECYIMMSIAFSISFIFFSSLLH